MSKGESVRQAQQISLEDAMDWPMSCTVERQANRLADMMQTVGADPARLARLRAGGAYAEARTKCLQCCNAREWEAPLFCPNFRVLKDCTKVG